MREKTIQEWKKKLGKNPRWAIRGLLVIYDMQTAEEQVVGETVEHNKVGFSGVDANILSSFAQQIHFGRKMSQKQMELIFKKMPKYAGQLYKISKQKGQKCK